MTREEALTLLLHHAFTHEEFDHPKSRKGFLGMLRPFDGTLYEDNFHELMQVLQVLKEEFRQAQLNREIIASYWSICHLTRMWALDPEGMLRSNKLIGQQQLESLIVWTDCISYTIMMLLDGQDDEVAFESYNNYVR